MRANTDVETFDYKFRCDGVSSAGHQMKTLAKHGLYASDKQN